MKTATISIRLFLAALAVAAVTAAAGCGGGGGSAPGDSISGSVQTPGGAVSARSADRTASALQNVSSAVTVNAYSVGSTGALALLATAQSSATGNFTIALPSGVKVASTLVLLSVEFGSVEMRGLATATSGVAISPVSEAVIQVIAQRMSASGRSFSDLTRAEITTVKTGVETALAGEDFAGATISDAIADAAAAAARDATVQAALESALPDNASTSVAIAVVATTDWTSGALSYITLDGDMSSAPATTNNVLSIHSDATVKADGGYVFVINRYGQDNITVLDPADGLSLVTQFSTGNGSNPQDIAAISATKAYISRLGSNSLLIVNPATGAELGSINLSGLALSDGIPDMAQMVKVGTKVFVLLQNLVDWAPAGPGILAVIDTATDTLIDADASTPGVQGVEISGWNPQSAAYNAATNRIYVSSSGDYYNPAVAGGIDSVNPDTFAASSVADKTALGGSPGSVAVVSSSKAYVAVSDSSFVNHIIPFNPSTGAVSASIYTPGGYTIGGIAVDPFGYLLVPDMSYETPGIVFIDTLTNTVAQGPVSVGLPPYAVAFTTMQSDN
jgi:DNA-binding beta-propeller fold protein YncE